MSRLPFLPVRSGAYRRIVARARRFDESVMAEALNFCDKNQQHASKFRGKNAESIALDAAE